MLMKEKSERNTLEMVSVETLVPQDHLLRKIDSAVDFTHIYDFVEELYCADNGRPSVDPVVLFKMVLIQHLYGIPSLRRTVEEINMNIAYRWFLGYLLNEAIPHFATISYNFRHRFTKDTIEQVFTWILFEAHKSGYLSPEVVFMDGTHIKANANIHKKTKKAIPAAARTYEKQLLEEINEDREAHGKKSFDGGFGNGEKKKSRFPQRIRRAGFSIKGNISGVLPMRPIRYATGITLYWIRWLPAEMFMTAWRLTHCMRKLQSVFLK